MVSDNPADMYAHIEDEMRIKRATRGPMAVFLRWALPPDPQAFFVWSEASHLAVKQNGSIWRYVPLAAMLVAGAMGLVFVLRMVPGLFNMVVIAYLLGVIGYYTVAWLLGL